MYQDYLFSLKYNMFILREWLEEGKYDHHEQGELHELTQGEFDTFCRMSPLCVQPPEKTTGWVNGKICWVDSIPHLELRPSNIRTKRDYLLSNIDRVVSNPLRYGEFTTEQKAEVAAYRKDLLDVPQQAGFPDDVVFPDIPSVLTQ